ncbi:hypothetical protein L2E82_41278 [Cichorium intybus]|uniref:Uncharacterized protein n=1 Tax=Cichorium intybus TaxID=13427 RepID=A0ACB9ANS3_CICIN|nr:hypothetical protein L2E82_41278 [Cichorium intybus]
MGRLRRSTGYDTKKNIVETLESTVSITRSRLCQIKSTSTAHLHMTIMLRDTLIPEPPMFRPKFPPQDLTSFVL